METDPCERLKHLVVGLFRIISMSVIVAIYTHTHTEMHLESIIIDCFKDKIGDFSLSLSPPPLHTHTTTTTHPTVNPPFVYNPIVAPHVDTDL
jgi:hypothetical protein